MDLETDRRVGEGFRHETTEKRLGYRFVGGIRWESVHAVNYELGSVLRRDTPGCSDLGGQT